MHVARPGEPLCRALGFREVRRIEVVTPDGVALAGVAMEREIEGGVSGNRRQATVR